MTRNELLARTRSFAFTIIGLVEGLPVAPARRSPAANTKASSARTPDGLPAYSLTDLIAELGTICRNQLRIGNSDHTLPRLTNTNPIQAKALELVDVTLTK